VNRLCTQVAVSYAWGFANINLRAYYAEGAKHLRLRDRRAARLAVPAARRVSGRRRHAACRASSKGFSELREVADSWTGDLPSIHAAQAAGLRLL
jgi:threonine synthase